MARDLLVIAVASAAAFVGCDHPDPGRSSSAAATTSTALWIATTSPGASGVTAAGLDVLAPLPGGRVLVRAPSTMTTRAAPTGITSWRPWSQDDRIARELRAPVAGPRGQVPVAIHVVPGADADLIASALAADGHDVVAVGAAGAWSRVVALLAPDRVAAATARLGGLDDVFFVERIRHVGLFNDRLVGSTQSGVQGSGVGQTPIWQHGLRGEGQIVGVIDTGADADSCYLAGDDLPVTNTWSEDGGYRTATGDHRKIVAYDFLYSCDQYPGRAGCDAPANAASWDNHGHGTHIAGTILGDSDGDPATYAAQDGLAPAAKLVMQDGGFGTDDCADLPGLGCPMLELGPLFAQAYAQGVRVVNNSWGDNENVPPPGQSNYTARTQDADRFMWEHPDFLIVFAAGNAGAGNREFSVGSPATLKNGLSVGSTRQRATATSDENLSSFSSRGWTGDGRIKPDLVAPGCNVSATSDRTIGGAGNCGVSGGCGTSYAAPVAVGAAALVRQYFSDGHHRGGAFAPSAALVKAVLISSSQPLRGVDNVGGPLTAIPSNEQGWGRIQLDRALAFAGSSFSLFVDDHRAPLDVGDGQVLRYAFDVAAGADLKVTLAWTDYPGVPDDPPAAPTVGDAATWTDPQLVNNLDLEVVAGDGSVYLGNRLVGGRSVTGGEPDHRNNVEQVLVPRLAAGRIQIAVRASRIAVAGQQFALVVTGALGAGGACTVPADGVITVERATAGGDVAVSWTDTAADASYVVERGDGGCDAAGWTEVATVTEPGHVDATATAGGTYGYRVRAERPATGQCVAAAWACVEVVLPVTAVDAGVGDAASADARGPGAGADGGDGGSDDDGGCGCRAGGEGAATLLLAPLVALVLSGRGHRHRRRRRQGSRTGS